MIDPVTGAIISTTAGSLTLVNALLKICQEHSQDPKASPPNIAELVATLPSAVLRATDDLIKQVEELRVECRENSIDLNLNLAELLRKNTGVFRRNCRNFLKTFQARIEAIATELSVLFDDVVSVCDCADRLHVVARSFEASARDKEQLTKDTAEELPLGIILQNLISHAGTAKVQLGDLNRK